MGFWKRAAGFLLSAAVAAVSLAGCNQQGAGVESGAIDTDYPVSIQGVSLSGEPAGVAVLSSEIGDAILAMGYEATLKARTEDCTQSDLSVLEATDDPARMAQLGATVALTCDAVSQEQSQSFGDAGVTLISIPAATSREDFERFYGEVGAVFRGGNTGYTHGQEIAQDIFLTIDDVTRAVPSGNAPITACYLFNTEGQAVTGDQFANLLIEAVGLTNGVYSSPNGEADLQTVTIANPSYIFCPTGVAQQISTAEGYCDLDAVKNGRVYEIDASLITSQGRDMIDAVLDIAAAVYPELAAVPGQGGETSSASQESSSSDSSSSEPSSSSGAVEMRSVLQIGDKGDDVKALQERLDELGYMYLPCTGEFGEGTQQAVKDFQLLNGYAATGIADETMQEVLFSSNVRTGPYYGQ